jgi:predicted nucleic acid-binding protein
MPELDRLIGKTVEIIVLEEADSPIAGAYDFWHGPSADQIAASQGVGPITSTDCLRGSDDASNEFEGFDETLRQWGARRTAELHQALSRYSVLPFDDELAWKWAEVMTIPGVPIAHGDAWIASTAIRHGMPLVTHNRKHFEKIPRLTIISEA